MNNIVVITIGDFSGDGHEKTSEFYYQSNRTRDELRDAYFDAKERFPLCCPASFCDEYEDRAIHEPHLSALQSAGAPMPEDVDCVGPDEMAALTVWFLRLVAPDLEMQRIEAPALMFCGKDAKGRYSDGIGYGCFT